MFSIYSTLNYFTVERTQAPTTSPVVANTPTPGDQNISANPTSIACEVNIKELILVNPPAKINWLLWISLGGGPMVALVLGIILLRRKSRNS
jgi:hypothetical protein